MRPMKERERERRKVGLLTFIVRYPRHMVRLRVENEGRILVCMATKSVERVHKLSTLDSPYLSREF